MFLFVSHAAEDSSAAIDVVRELERRGVSCWVGARDLEAGKSHDGQIGEAIENCRAMLLILSDRGDDGETIRRDVALASEACKIIVPLRIDGPRSKKGLRIRLSDLRAIDAFMSRERTIDELVRKLQPSLAEPDAANANVPRAEAPAIFSAPLRNVSRPAASSAAIKPRTASITPPAPPILPRSAPIALQSAPTTPWPAPAARRSAPRSGRGSSRDVGPSRRVLVLGSAVVAVTLGALVLGMILQSSPGTAAKSAPIQIAKTDSRLQDDSARPAPETPPVSAPDPARLAPQRPQVALGPSAQPAPSSALPEAAPGSRPAWLPADWQQPPPAAPAPTKVPAPSSRPDAVPAIPAQQTEVDAPAQSLQSCAKNPVHLASVSSRPAKPLSAVEECGLKPKDTFKECVNCPIEVVVPAGSFTMGSAKGPKALMPQHDVTIPQPFAVGQFAVTFDEWDACVSDGGCGGYRPSDEGWGRGQRPVINVSWNDAKAYVAWLTRKTGKTYRLLTEAEREYVTRAGTHTPYWWGSSISTKQANYDGTIQFAPTDYVKAEPGEYRQKTVPVNSFAANPFGLYQVHGNVLEWTEDCYHAGYVGAPTDGSAWIGGACNDDAHIVRGGSWDEPWAFALSEFRGKGVDRSNIIGLRVARTLQAPSKSNSVLAQQQLESALDSYADGKKPPDGARR